MRCGGGGGDNEYSSVYFVAVAKLVQDPALVANARKHFGEDVLILTS